MRKLVLAVGLAWSGGLGAPAALAQSPLRLVTTDFRPYVWCEAKPATGTEVARRGTDVAVLAELFRRVGRPYTLGCLPWRRALEMVKAGQAEGLLPGYKSPEREAFLLYLDEPLHVSRYSLFVRRGGEFPFESFADLAGKRIGIERGHRFSPDFQAEAMAGRFAVEEVSSPEQSLRKLLAGRIDVYINNHDVVVHSARELGLLERITALPRAATQGSPSYLSISRAAAIDDKAGLIRQLNQALREMWRDGTMERILAKEGPAP